MAVERQAVDTRTQGVQKVRRTTRTVDSAVDNGKSNYEPSQGLQIAEGLMKLTEQGAELYYQELKKDIELDKVRQTYRAYQGLTPTDDATVAGKRAYDVVTSRDEVLDINDKIVQGVQANPEMTDEEYGKLSREAYGSLLSRHENDPAMMTFLSSEMQRSQPILHEARAKARQDYQKVKNQDAFQHSLNTYKDAAQSPADLASAIEGSLTKEGTGLGVDVAKQRNILMNQAKQDANKGDGRLLEALKGLEWAKGDTRIQTAQTNFETWESQTYATQIGSRMANLQSAWENGRANWSQVEIEMRRMNERFPGTFSAAKVASIKEAGLKKQQENVQIASAVSASFKPLYDQNAIKLGMQGLETKELNKIVAGVTQQFDAVGQKLVEQGQLSPEQLGTWKLKQKMNWSKANQVVIPQIKGTLESLMYMDPDQWSVEGGVPANVTSAMKVFETMDPGTLAMYGNDKLSAYWLNYNKFKTQENDSSAMQRAYKQTFDPVKLSQKERADMNKQVEKAVADKSAGFWSRILEGGVAIPDSEQNRVAQEIQGLAQDLVTSGAYDVEGVTDFAVKRWAGSNTQLPNGTYVRGNTSKLAPLLNVSPEEVPQAFDDYLSTNLTELQEESGIDNLSTRDVRFQYRPQSHSVVIVDKYGNTISNPLPLEAIGDSYRKRSTERKVDQALDSAATHRELKERQDNVTFHSDQLAR